MDRVFIATFSSIVNNPEIGSEVKIEQIRAMLAELEALQATGVMAQLLTELACDGHVNPELTSRGDELFPGLDLAVDASRVRPVDLGRDYVFTKIDGLLDVKGFKAVRPDKGMRWAAKNRETHRNGWYLASGQTGCHSDGNDVALVLYGSDGRRNAHLRGVRRKWDRSYLVLAEPKGSP